MIPDSEYNLLSLRRLLTAGRIYSLATSDYLANGGDGYDSLKRGTEVPFSQQVTPLIADIVISVLRRQSTLSATATGRISFVNGRDS